MLYLSLLILFFRAAKGYFIYVPNDRYMQNDQPGAKKLPGLFISRAVQHRAEKYEGENDHG